MSSIGTITGSGRPSGPRKSSHTLRRAKPPSPIRSCHSRYSSAGVRITVSSGGFGVMPASLHRPIRRNRVIHKADPT